MRDFLKEKVFVSRAELEDGENATSARCRTERGGDGLSLEEYRLDTCARCYIYLPPFAFVSRDRKLRYNLASGLLFDTGTNASFPADPGNTSHPLYDTFASDLFARKWIKCCEAALDCCVKMREDPPPDQGSLWCPRTWDGWQCWDDTPAGETASSPCQEHVYFRSEPSTCPKFAEKKCWDNGTWYMNEWRNEWSNYSGCGRVDRMRRLQTFHIATYAVSIFFLLPALFIFTTYKQLQVHRIAMHRNLFAALLVNATLVITFKAVVILDELDNSGNRRTILEAW
ncbi:hypothetical protein JTE90_000396 [Oedothorax gibbosus]|uniref:G-protein coupled receptors family 2 profile 1 domain-containing protein n=1 Tax=Oedothorax gibbosus TaxID=931172 RepID=A0AAV6UTG2_9ARAC|nr:hypothetical protein JTE90_000396 [Oedothorax gibbosus]